VTFKPKVQQPGAEPTIAKPRSGAAPARIRPQIASEVPASVGVNQPDDRPVPDLAQQRIDFRIEDFVRVIKQHGQRVMWRQAMLCTCQNPETRHALVTCTICQGLGTRYVAPLEIQAVFQQHDKKTKIYERFGMWEQSLAMCTLEAQYRLAYRDSLELLDALSSYYEVLVKGDRRAYKKVLPANRDVARYRIKHVTQMIVQPYPERRGASREILPELGIHYEVQDGQIVWLARGENIPNGSLVSIRYDYNPVYLVLNMPHATRNDVNATRAPGMSLRAYPLTCGVQLDFTFDATKNPEGMTIGGQLLPQSASTGDICSCGDP
jgi:hypothetical protein